MKITLRLNYYILAMLEISMVFTSVRHAIRIDWPGVREQELAFAKRRAAGARYWFKLWLHGIA